MEGQMNFFDLLKSPLEKATTYEEVMVALGDECVYCIYDQLGTCCCPSQCVLGNKFKNKTCEIKNQEL